MARQGRAQPVRSWWVSPKQVAAPPSVTPPSFIADYETVYSSNTSPKTTGTFNGLTGDVLVAAVADSNDEGTENYTISSTPAETWTEATETTGVTSNDAWAQPATTVLTADRTGMTVTATRTAGGTTNFFGLTVAHFRGSDGVGANAATTGAGGQPALDITTQYDNSAIVYMVVDWLPVNGATRTHRTVNGYTPTVGNGQELSYYFNSGQYTVYVAYIPDAGTAGSKTVGLTAPAGQDSQVVAVEVRGTASTGGQSATVPFDSTSTLSVTPLVEHPATVTFASTSTLAVTPLVTHPATVGMDSTSTLTVTPLVTHPATVALVSSSTLAVTPLVTHPATVAFASTSTLGVVLAGEQTADVAFASTSALAVTPLVTHPYAVAFDSSSTLAVTPLVTHPATVALASTSALTVTAVAVKSATVGLTQSSTLTVTPLVTHPYAVAFASSSTLSVLGRQTIPSTVAFASTSTLGVAVQGQQSATVGLTQSSTLTVTPLVTHPYAVAFASSSTLSIAIAVTRLAIITLASGNTLTIGATITQFGAILFASTSTLNITAVVEGPPLYEGGTWAASPGTPQWATTIGPSRWSAQPSTTSHWLTTPQPAPAGGEYANEYATTY